MKKTACNQKPANGIKCRTVAIVLTIAIAAAISGCGVQNTDAAGTAAGAVTESTTAGSFNEAGAGGSGTAAGSLPRALTFGKTRVILTSGFDKDTIFTIDAPGKEGMTLTSMSASDFEGRVYLANLCAQYRVLLGENVFDGADSGIMTGKVKNEALAALSRVKTLDLMAASEGVTLTGEEIMAADRAAEAYAASLSDADRVYLSGAEGTAAAADFAPLFEAYALAGKMYRTITDAVDDEISDDEARTAVVEGILFPEDRALAEQVLAMIHNSREQGDGVTFEMYAAKYSADSTVTFKVRRGDPGTNTYYINDTLTGEGETLADTTFAETAFTLTVGDYSEVIHDDRGYWILKCISAFDRQETDANKVLILASRRAQAFDAAVTDFAGGLETDLNAERWNAVPLPEKTVTTADFFTRGSALYGNE